MARILCLVWSIDTKDFFFPQKEQYKYLKNSQNVNLEGLFQGLDDLDDIDKKNIHTLLAAMHLNDPEQRLSIPQAFKLFSKIELGCKKDITACYAEEVAPYNDEQPSSSWWIDALTGVFNTVVDILEEVRFMPQASKYGHSFSYF